MVIRILLSLLVLTCVSRSVVADGKSPEDALADKGLAKLAEFYALETDRTLSVSLREMRAVETKYKANDAKRVAIQKAIDDATQRMTRMEAEYHARVARLNAMDKNAVGSYNKQVGEVNGVVAGLHKAVALVKTKQKELGTIPDMSGDYIRAVNKLAKSMEDTNDRYTELASDTDVKSAIAKINETASPKFKLGPSDTFTKELTRVRQTKSRIIAAPLALKFAGGVPHIDVSVNEKEPVSMVVDSGAALVTLSAAVAEKCDIKPSDDDERITLHVADGKEIEARLVTIKRMQVGPFTVENVECAIIPDSAPNVPNLLGGTFLRHFSYNMDLASATLHLSQLSGQSATDSPDSNTGAKPESNVKSQGL
jgi:clan AA aspartic protease (TIGR02281 family)